MKVQYQMSLLLAFAIFDGEASKCWIWSPVDGCAGNSKYNNPFRARDGEGSDATCFAERTNLVETCGTKKLQYKLAAAKPSTQTCWILTPTYCKNNNLFTKYENWGEETSATWNANAAKCQQRGEKLRDTTCISADVEWWYGYTNPSSCDRDHDCSGHGTTTDKNNINGCTCSCDAGWEGDDCGTLGITCADSDPATPGDQAYVCAGALVLQDPLPAGGCTGGACSDDQCCLPACGDSDLTAVGAQPFVGCAPSLADKDAATTCLITGCDVSTCCQATCADTDPENAGEQPFDCGQASAFDVMPTTACTDGLCTASQCCQQTCVDSDLTDDAASPAVAFDCGTSLASITPTPSAACVGGICSEAQCCQATCADSDLATSGDQGFQCLGKLFLKSPASTSACTGEGCDTAQCCEATCGDTRADMPGEQTFECPSGLALTSDPSGCSGGICDESQCCEVTCADTDRDAAGLQQYECTVPLALKNPLPSSGCGEECSNAECCEITCGDMNMDISGAQEFACPRPLVLISPNKICIGACSQEQCCQPQGAGIEDGPSADQFGCWVKAVSGCPGQAEWTSTGWEKDPEPGAAHKDQDACFARKYFFDTYCAAADTLMLFNPPAPEGDPGCWVRTPSGCPGDATSVYRDWAKVGDEEASKEECLALEGDINSRCKIDDALANYVPAPPHKSGGCWLRLPYGCPAQRSYNTDWSREVVAGAGESEQNCEARRTKHLASCGTEDVLMHFVATEAMRYYRFTPTLAWDSEDFQISELYFRFGRTRLNMNNVRMTDDTGVFEIEEPIKNIIDGDRKTKVCCKMGPMTVDFRKQVLVDDFAFVSANDNNPRRSPARWRMEGSVDGNLWVLLQEQMTSYGPLNKPYQRSAWFSIAQRPADAALQEFPKTPGCWLRTLKGCTLRKGSKEWKSDKFKDADKSEESCRVRQADHETWCGPQEEVLMQYNKMEGVEMQFWRFSPVRVGEGIEFQLAELTLAYNGIKLDMTEATASGRFQSDAPASNSIDGQDSTKTCCGMGPITVKLKEPQAANEFWFTTANDEPSRRPIRWMLEASLDGINFVTIHDQGESSFNTPEEPWSRNGPFKFKKLDGQPQVYLPAPPMDAGCFILTPAGCPKQDSCCGVTWMKQPTATTAEACEARQDSYDAWCSTVEMEENSEMHFVREEDLIKHFRFSPLQVREGAQFAIGDFALGYNGDELDMSLYNIEKFAGKSLRQQGFHKDQGTDKAFDGVPATKTCCAIGPISFSMNRPVLANMFHFTTAPDVPGRDPIQWKLEGSYDGENWGLLHVQDNAYNTPTYRETQTEWFPLEELEVFQPVPTEAPTPRGKGCWLKLPTGCPGNKINKRSNKWFEEERNNAKTSRSNCNLRLQGYKKYCGVDNAEMEFNAVALAPAPVTAWRYWQFNAGRTGGKNNEFSISELYFQKNGRDVDARNADATGQPGKFGKSSEGPAKAVDGITSTKACCGKGWLKLDFKRAVEIDRFGFATSEDTPDRDPKTWVLRASNDGKKWTVLHRQNSIYKQLGRLEQSDWFDLDL